MYCSRVPRDIALSCYFQLFTERAQHFSYDLADCGIRCREVRRLAGHWLKLLPLHMIEINYESLVADLEGGSRRLIEFLGWTGIPPASISIVRNGLSPRSVIGRYASPSTAVQSVGGDAMRSILRRCSRL